MPHSSLLYRLPLFFGRLAAVFILALIFAGTSKASLVTAHFSGVIDSYFRLGIGADPAKIGTPISGYFTFDALRAEYHDSLLYPGRRAEDIGRTISGCPVVYFGACWNSEGGELPLILDFHVDTSFGSFDLGASGVGIGRDYASIGMGRRFPGYYSSSYAGQDRYLITRESSGTEYSGDPRSSYVQRQFNYSTSLELTSYGNKFLPDVLDWTSPIDLALADSHYLGLLNNSSRYGCTSGVGCNQFLGYDPGSFSATAKLNTLTYTVLMPIPEPATAVLLCIGLAVLGMSRKRQPKA
ncbi:protein of unknown function [Thauera humireducens]|uniref:PEP-CTERM sorting domain-containing protein n=1 Tax=Thauera humireducens TaxID=1134435 RepID=UPI002467A0D0|nr:PEP-CTERM sorting domain-containing protein [Thauera humireducens]CAH1748231.1 protein of unknown function [Thauera humireducens]